ncbi:scabin-related ADP-ribosyltransferase [Streptomyces chartreusis]
MAFPKGRKFGQGSWVYEVAPQGPGISMNKALGFSYPFRIEKEVVFPGGIQPSQVVGAPWYVNGSPSGDFVPNPGYGVGP